MSTPEDRPTAAQLRDPAGHSPSAVVGKEENWEGTSAGVRSWHHSGNLPASINRAWPTLTPQVSHARQGSLPLLGCTALAMH